MYDFHLRRNITQAEWKKKDTLLILRKFIYYF